MKKTFALFCALALLSGTALGAAHTAVSGSGQAIAFKETTLAGDPAAAEGFTAQLRSTYNMRLFFDTALSFGREAETQFSFFPNGQGINYDCSPVRCAVALNHDWEYLSGTKTLPEELRPEYRALLEPLAEDTPAGKTCTDTVRAADFISHLPVRWRITLPHQTLWDEPEASSPFFAYLHDQFQFPVPDDLLVMRSVTRNEQGDLTKWSVQEASSNLRSETPSCTTLKNLYFVPQLVDGESPLASTPLGRGVYRLPILRREPTAEDLVSLYSLRDGVSVLAMAADRTDRFVFLALEQAGETLLQVVDTQTGLSQPPLPLWTGATEHVQLLAGEDCLLTADLDGRFCFFILENGRFVPSLQGTLPTMEGAPAISDYHTAVAFDGQRMALASSDGTGSSLSLAVLDETGLLYCGTYANSLDRCVEVPQDQGVDYAVPLCRPVLGYPLTLRSN